ncbi:hypothetical protein Bca101_033910 [Brassica carinata]
MPRRLGLPLTTTRLFNPAPWISHPHRITTASSMSQQSVEIGTVRGASTRCHTRLWRRFGCSKTIRSRFSIVIPLTSILCTREGRSRISTGFLRLPFEPFRRSTGRLQELRTFRSPSRPDRTRTPNTSFFSSYGSFFFLSK